jgi:hypothetical protein
VTKINPIIPPVADEAGVIKVWPFSQNPDGSLSPSSSAGPSSNVNIEYLQGAAPALTNPLPVELSDGTQAIGTAGNPLSVDVISGGGSNASVGADNALAPTSDTLIGTVDAGGKLQAVSAANPLPISGSISASNPSVGTDNATAPTSATEIGSIDGGGKLQGASTTNPIPVALPTATVTTLTPPTAAAIGAACPVPPTAAAIAGAIVSNPPTISIASAQKVEVYDGTNTAAVKAASTAAADGDTSLVVQLNPKQPNLDTALNVHDASPASQAVTNTGTFAVQEATLDGCISLNIVAVHDASPASQAVTNVGTFAVQAACSGTVTTTPPSHASTNVDQLAGTTVDTNSGNKSAGTLRVVVATDQPNLTTALNVHDASPSSVAVTNTGTFATQDSNLSGCISASKVAVSIAAMPSTAVTNTGTFAVQEATIDGCIAAGVVAVHDSSPASQAVTNTGTFAVQATTKTALTPAAPTATSVGITSASAVAANASRKGLVLTNTSGGTISLGFGSAAVLNSGITLSSGGSFEMDEYTFYAGAVYAIASGAASNLAIQEYST